MDDLKDPEVKPINPGSPKVDLKQIEKEFYEELGENQETEKKSGDDTGAPGVQPSRWMGEDFISDDVMAFVLGCKNSAIVSILAKELGKTEKKMLSDLYEVTDKELKIYKRILQSFIRDNFPEYMDKIAKVTNADLAAILILETGRWHEGRLLVQAAKDKNGKPKEEK